MTATITNALELKEFLSDHWQLITDENFAEIIKGMFRSYTIGKPETLTEAIDLIDKHEHNLYLPITERRLFFI
jgi:tryptophan synthase beta subunit